MKPLRNFAILLALAFALGWLHGNGPDEQAAEQMRYCQMVAEFHASNGDHGWPDYRNTFAAECNTDGTIREEK